MGALRQAAKTESSPAHSTRARAPGQASSRRPSLRKMWALLGFALVAVSIGSYSSRARRERDLASEHRDAEVKDLDERFRLEEERLESRLQDLRMRAAQGLPLAAVTSFSIWEKRVQADGHAGYSQVGGAAEPANAWERALIRILPATIESRFGAIGAPNPLVLPLDGPSGAADSSLRLALFREAAAPAVGGSAEKVTALAFRSAALIEKSEGAGRIKRYLIEPSGLVLAHASPEEVGTRTAALGDLFRKSERAGRIDSRSWEGFPSTIRFEKVPGWNAYFVMERTHVPAKAGVDPSIPELFFFGATVAFGLLLIFLGIHAPKSPKTEAAAPEPGPSPVSPAPPASQRRGYRELRSNPPRFTPKAPIVSFPESLVSVPTELDSELGRFVSARIARQEGHEASRAARDRILLESFDVEARGASVGRLERTLADAVSRAVGSPVLFFRYDPRQGVAELTTSSGSAVAAAAGSGGMSFSVPATLVTDIHSSEVAGRKLDLHDHVPLARLMLSRFGIATFEAWPMASSRPAVEGPSRLHGVLVITQSGVDSVLQRGLVGALLDHAADHARA